MISSSLSHSSPPIAEFLASSGPRRLAAWVLGVSAFAALFTASFVGALHQPRPHHVPVAVVSSARGVATLQEQLGALVPGEFMLERFGSVHTATTSLRNAAVDAVWVPPSLAADRSSAGERPMARLFVASALGPVSTQVIEQTFVTLGKGAGATVAVKDLVSLPADDPIGISSFLFSVGVFLPTFLGSIVMALLLRGTPALASMAAILVLAGSVGLVVVTIVDAGLGVLVGHFGTLFGVAALTSIAFSAPTVVVGRMLGPIGALLALLTFVVLGLPASGGPLGTAFLPGLQRELSPGLPLTNAVDAVRIATYFGGRELPGHLATLAIWAGGGLVMLAVVALFEANRSKGSSVVRSR